MRRKKRLTQPLIHAMQIRRLCFFAGCLLTGFGGLAYHLVNLQVVQHERFVEAARRNTEKTVFRQSKRGDILDIHGNLLKGILDIIPTSLHERSVLFIGSSNMTEEWK